MKSSRKLILIVSDLVERRNGDGKVTSDCDVVPVHTRISGHRTGTDAGQGPVGQQPKPYSPYVDQHLPQQVFFGDTHFHSSLSVDSGLIGNKLGLDQAFRFARGE